jgi:hypothetical protein
MKTAMKKKKCESCGTILITEEFDICKKCMSKNDPFLDIIDNENDEGLNDGLNEIYFDDDYDY